MKTSDKEYRTQERNAAQRDATRQRGGWKDARQTARRAKSIRRNAERG